MVEVGQDDAEYGVDAFDCALLCAGWVVIGASQRVHFVAVATQTVASHVLGEGTAYGYFGHMYPYAEFILVASGQHLARFDRLARRVRQTELLAIDGVLVDRVDERAIYGQAEWDPPGGWRPFSVALETGAVIA